MSNLPTGVQPGYPHSTWTVNELCDLIQEVLTSSANNVFAGAVGATTLAETPQIVTPLTGFTNTIANGVSVYLMTPAGTLATGTLTMPAAPVANQFVTIMSSHTITALTLNANTNQTISNAPTALTANTSVQFFFNGTNWYRVF
jgi:hypothetical protein